MSWPAKLDVVFNPLTGVEAGFTSVNGGYLLGANGFVPITKTYADIVAAFNAAVQNNGGVVYLSAGLYDIGANTLPMASGVVYKGDGYKLLYTQYPDSGSATLDETVGTIVKGDGTADGFAFNTQGLTLAQAQTLYGTGTDGSTAFSNAGITGAGILGLGIKGCKMGIHAGAQYRPSFWYCEFDVAITDCTQWGAWFENFQHCGFNINSFGNLVGNLAMGVSSNGYLAPGNSAIQDILTSVKQGVNNLPIRGALFFSYNGTNLGSLNILNLQSNRFSQITSTTAATMSNASTSIGVTDLTRFAVGMPVAFDATANGFTANQIYFVLSRSGTTGAGSITVGNSQPSLAAEYQPSGWVNDSQNVNQPTAISATGATAVNIITRGFPCIEVVGFDNARVLGFDCHSVDAEGGGTTKFYAQRCRSMTLNVPNTNDDVTSVQEFTFRDVYGDVLTNNGSCRFDVDTASFWRQYGQRGVSMGSTPVGISAIPNSGLGNALAAYGLNLKPQAPATTLPTMTFNRRGNDTLEFNGGLQFVRQEKPTTGQTINTSGGPVHIFDSASGTAILPTISEVNVGVPVYFYNASTSGSCVLSVSSSQLINRDLTSINVPSLGSVTLQAISYGATYGWQLIGSSSKYIPRNDGSGTPGAVTQQRGRGRVAIAAGTSSVVVTNPNILATSTVLAVITSNDSTAILKNAVPAAGSVTINLTANATANCNVDYVIVN